MKIRLFILLLVLLCGCGYKPEVTRIIVETKVVNEVNYLMICEKVDGHIQAETCSWHYEDFTPAPFEYNPDYQVPLIGNHTRIGLV